MLWLGVLLGILLVAAVVTGVVLWRKSRRVGAPLVEPAAPTVELADIFERGIPAGLAPDYALTGEYYPVGYWPIYWPATYNGGGGTPGRRRLLGNDLIRAGRGVP